MLTVVSIAFILVLTCVGIHYNSLVTLSNLYEKFGESRRWVINVLIIGALLTHIFEMSLFGLSYWLLARSETYGAIRDACGEISTDYWYFSFVVYTSLGFGDLTPSGSIRMLTAMETLTGLVLIAWTASFMFVEMQAWAKAHSPRHQNNDSANH